MREEKDYLCYRLYYIERELNEEIVSTREGSSTADRSKLSKLEKSERVGEAFIEKRYC